MIPFRAAEEDDSDSVDGPKPRNIELVVGGTVLGSADKAEVKPHKIETSPFENREADFKPDKEHLIAE